ncbi:MAG TPA: hypothetical protein VK541_22035 [Pedobacter sp.]|uniref:hypothetical protein n=1 Tax=Pedobacter sp. TaxID=1411316 RepID=UPI002B753CAA|nr:hypothetical protein [Pedobacter sp.]HMI05183.1 hypothetical protein [Pedobacter sp.]
MEEENYYVPSREILEKYGLTLSPKYKDSWYDMSLGWIHYTIMLDLNWIEIGEYLGKYIEDSIVNTDRWLVFRMECFNDQDLEFYLSRIPNLKRHV